MKKHIEEGLGESQTQSLPVPPQGIRKQHPPGT